MLLSSLSCKCIYIPFEIVVDTNITLDITYTGTYTYNGGDHTPTITVNYGGKILGYAKSLTDCANKKYVLTMEQVKNKQKYTQMLNPLRLGGRRYHYCARVLSPSFLP